MRYFSSSDSESDTFDMNPGLLAAGSIALRKHLVLIGIVTLLVALVYARVSGAWFCGYDDFNESYRAAFQDS
ncbi:MAG: hypothetical protein ACXVAF_18335, partial [Vulcanimicrobiaceae bacterium]